MDPSCHKTINSYSDDQIFRFGRSPDLLYAGCINERSNWQFSLHKHDDFCEILFIAEGTGSFLIEGNTYYARKGDVLIYNKGVLHEEKAHNNTHFKAYFCGIGNLYVKQLAEGCLISRHTLPIVQVGECQNKIEDYFSNILEEGKFGLIGSKIACQNILVLLLILIYRIVSTQNSLQDQEVSIMTIKVKEFIEQHYTKQITLKVISEMYYVSESYMSHIFKNNTGFSPINYLINRRIEEAKRLLKQTDQNIHSIAFSVGYENTSYFCTLFKKYVGISPGFFREKNCNPLVR